MIFRIKDYRSIRNVEISVSGLTLLVGPNASGKSSVAQAIGSVLSGHVMPYDIPKKDAHELVRRGTKKASVYVEADNGTHATIEWPEAKLISGDGLPVMSTTIATGIESPAMMSSKDRAVLFSELFKAFPDLDSLKKAFPRMAATTVDALWKSIQSEGWDRVYANAKEKGARLKGQWENVTKEKYGSKKADGWTPTDLTFDPATTTLEKLEAAVDAADKVYQRAISVSAVSKDERARTKEVADMLDARKAAAADIKKDLDIIQIDYDAAERALETVTQALPTPGMPCPKCGATLVMIKGTLEEGGGDAEKIERAKILVRARRDKVSALAKRLSELGLAYNDASIAVRGSEDARKKLAEMSGTKAPSGPSPDEAMDLLENAQAAVYAFKAHGEATKLNRTVIENEAIIDALSPTGLRAECLEKTYERVNVDLSGMCKASGWEPVRISADGELWYGFTPYWLASQSEQYRVRAVVQVYLAEIQDARFLIFDGADILDVAGRNGLVRLVTGSSIPALICMTMKKEDAKVLSEKMAASETKLYIIENGEVQCGKE